MSHSSSHHQNLEPNTNIKTPSTQLRGYQPALLTYEEGLYTAAYFLKNAKRFDQVRNNINKTLSVEFGDRHGGVYDAWIRYCKKKWDAAYKQFAGDLSSGNQTYKNLKFRKYALTLAELQKIPAGAAADVAAGAGPSSQQSPPSQVSSQAGGNAGTGAGAGPGASPGGSSSSSSWKNNFSNAFKALPKQMNKGTFQRMGQQQTGGQQTGGQSSTSKGNPDDANERFINEGDERD